MRVRKSPPVPASPSERPPEAAIVTPPVHDVVLAARWAVNDVTAWLAPLHGH